MFKTSLIWILYVFIGSTIAMQLKSEINLDVYMSRVTVCPDTQTSVNNECVCNAGYEPDDVSCRLCPVSTYKPQAGNFNCFGCPTGTTSFVGSENYADCLCEAGQTSSGVACELCAVNSYKTFIGNSTCLSCHDHSTSLIGSTVLTDCQCNVGYTLNANLLCDPCASNTYKDTIGNTECLSCIDKSQSVPSRDVFFDVIFLHGFLSFWPARGSLKL